VVQFPRVEAGASDVRLPRYGMGHVDNGRGAAIECDGTEIARHAIHPPDSAIQVWASCLQLHFLSEDVECGTSGSQDKNLVRAHAAGGLGEHNSAAPRR